MIAVITFRLGFVCCMLASSDGLSRGLALFQSGEVDVTIVNISKKSTHGCKGSECGRRYENSAFTSFYAKARRSKRSHSWELLRGQFDLPWLCGMRVLLGVLDNSEYFGANERVEWKIQGFTEVVDLCNFQDILFMLEICPRGNCIIRFPFS